MSKTALVTGATGLLGREVLKQFENDGWKVIGAGFSRASGNIIKLDLTSQDDVEAALEKHKPSAVVHCKQSNTLSSLYKLTWRCRCCSPCP